MFTVSMSVAGFKFTVCYVFVCVICTLSFFLTFLLSLDTMISLKIFHFISAIGLLLPPLCFRFRWGAYHTRLRLSHLQTARVLRADSHLRALAVLTFVLR